MQRRIVVPADILAIASPGAVALGRRESHYARDVLRLGVGDEVTLIDGLGMTGKGHIESIDKGGVRIYLTEFGQSSALESPLKMTIVMGLPKGARWDLVIQKTTELGVDRIWPVYTARGDVQIPANKIEGRMARWMRIAAEAARQCGRSVAPDLGVPRKLTEALDLIDLERDVDLKLMAWEGLAAGHKNRGLGAALPPPLTKPKHAVLLIGPEGGLEPREVKRCRDHSFEAVSLGPRILRAETAAVIFAALVQHRLGDLL